MNFTWTPMDDSVKVVNPLLGGMTNGVHGGSNVLSSDGKTSIDFLELLVNGPPLPGPLAYVSDGFVDQCNRGTSELLMAPQQLADPDILSADSGDHVGATGVPHAAGPCSISWV
jgi:hypothetical protein